MLPNNFEAQRYLPNTLNKQQYLQYTWLNCIQGIPVSAIYILASNRRDSKLTRELCKLCTFSNDNRRRFARFHARTCYERFALGRFKARVRELLEGGAEGSLKLFALNDNRICFIPKNSCENCVRFALAHLERIFGGVIKKDKNWDFVPAVQIYCKFYHFFD